MSDSFLISCSAYKAKNLHYVLIVLTPCTVTVRVSEKDLIVSSLEKEIVWKTNYEQQLNELKSTHHRLPLVIYIQYLPTVHYIHTAAITTISTVCGNDKWGHLPAAGMRCAPATEESL